MFPGLGAKPGKDSLGADLAYSKAILKTGENVQRSIERLLL